jgi:Fe-S oxidoreductase
MIKKLQRESVKTQAYKFIAYSEFTMRILQGFSIQSRVFRKVTFIYHNSCVSKNRSI